MYDGTRPALEQAGLPPRLWSFGVKHYCFVRNALAIGDDRSPWFNRHGKECKALLIPLGALVHFKPSPAKPRGIEKFAPRAQPGIFLGYHLNPGGEWKGDYICALLKDVRGLNDDPNMKVSTHRIKEVIFDPEAISYPLRPRYEEINYMEIPPPLALDGGEPDAKALGDKRDSNELRDEPGDDDEGFGPEDPDEWSYAPDTRQWIRHHKTTRQNMFDPTGVPVGPQLDWLETKRVTSLYSDGVDQVMTIVNDWTNPGFASQATSVHYGRGKRSSHSSPRK